MGDAGLQPEVPPRSISAAVDGSQPPAPAKRNPKLPHKHPLELYSRAGAFHCDGCRRWSRRLPDKRRYRCTQGCDFDLCHDCVITNTPGEEKNEEKNEIVETNQPGVIPRSISARIQELKPAETIMRRMVPLAGKIDHEHPLYPNNYKSGHWFCDGCRRSSRTNPDMNKFRYSCTQGCPFELCKDCYARRPFS